MLADKLIETRARTVVEEHSIGSGLDIAVDKGNLTLSGVVGQGDNLFSAIEKMRQIDGVKGVDNRSIASRVTPAE